MSSPLSLLSELEGLLTPVEGAESSLVKVADLRSILVGLGYTEEVAKSYTESRASALRSIVTSLLDEVNSSSSLPSYSDRAYSLSVVSDLYLQVAHAFKVDSTVWSYAQSSLLPVLTAARDEDSIDTALALLKSHLEGYLEALSSWF